MLLSFCVLKHKCGVQVEVGIKIWYLDASQFYLDADSILNIIIACNNLKTGLYVPLRLPLNQLDGET